MKSRNYLSELLRFSAPIYTANLFQQLYHATDSLVIGNLVDEQAFAAVGAVSGISYMLFQVSAGVTSGYSVELARSYGAGEDSQNCCTTDILLSSLLLGVLSAGILFLGLRPLLRLLSVPASLAEEAQAYIGILILALPLTFLHNMAGAALRARGDGCTPSTVLISSLFLNLVLDLLMIGPLDMGVYGAALATVFSQVFSLVVCLIAFGRKHGFRLDFRESGSQRRNNLLIANRIGLPCGLQFFITSLGINIVQKAVNAWEPAVIAGFSAANRLHAVFAQLHVALGTALMTFTAQDAGSRQGSKLFARASAVFPLFLLCAVGNALILGLLGPSFAAIFVRGATDKMIQSARIYFLRIIWFYPFLTSIFLTRNLLVGLGKSTCALIGALVEFFTRLLVSTFLPTSRSYSGICMADPLAWLVGLIPLYLFFLSERKKRQSGDLSG